MRTITNVFLLNLAISDILLGVLCMPVTLVGTLLRHFIFGEFFCKLIQFSQAASVAVSSWTLVAISCERYYAICHPLRSRRWQTRSHAYKIIAIIWCGSMLCMLPIAMFSQLMPTSRPGLRKCRENWPTLVRPYERSYNLLLSLILLVLPLVILSVAYILITRTLYVGMRVERAMIFGGRQVDVESSMKSYTCNGSRRERHSYISASSLSSNTSSLLRTKFNLSVRSQEAAAATAGDASSHRQGNLEKITNETDTFCQQKPHQHHYQQQQQQQQQSHRLYPQYNFPNCHQQHQIESRELQSHDQHCCEPFARLCCKRYNTNSTNVSSGRPHLYCMRFATLKTTALAAAEGNGESNFCTTDCCISSGNTAALNSSANNANIISATEALSSTSTSTPTTYRYQLNHQLAHTQARCYCLNTKTKAQDPLNNKRSLKATESVLRRNNIAKNLESKKRVVKMLFVLVLEFFICWTPLYVINTAAMYIGSAIYEYIDYTSISVLQLLAYSSSCCNPITYCFMNANFRRAFWDTFKDMQWCGKQCRRKRPTTQNGAKLCLAGSVRVNSCTVQTIIDSPRL